MHPARACMLTASPQRSGSLLVRLLLRARVAVLSIARAHCLLCPVSLCGTRHASAQPQPAPLPPSQAPIICASTAVPRTCDVRTRMQCTRCMQAHKEAPAPLAAAASVAAWAACRAASAAAACSASARCAAAASAADCSALSALAQLATRSHCRQRAVSVSREHATCLCAGQRARPCCSPV